MKTPRIANAIGQIDDGLVAGAAKCKTKNKKHWLKWGSLAACFASPPVCKHPLAKRDENLFLTTQLLISSFSSAI